ncbi:hypothetical protein [Nonomuraea recticatena]|uniref:Uncharacterized protein n=1 Tax=Nonomuraea recticatena TaxID=46178 RepID=A0ABN3THJ9_9ACTN
MTEITPARLRDLAGRAEALAAEVRALLDEAATGTPEREQLFVAMHASDWLTRAAEDLQQAAGKLARLRSLPDDACGVPWGVCPEHGATLSSSGNVAICGECGRTWTYDRLGSPCPEPVRWKMTDKAGTELAICDGHALAARQQVEDVTLTSLDQPGQEDAT